MFVNGQLKKLDNSKCQWKTLKCIIKYITYKFQFTSILLSLIEIKAIFLYFRDMFDRPKTEKVKKLDNSKCIPQTSRLDSSVHKTIVFNFVLLFFLGSFQSYIKRLRPFFCACFYPNRDQERSVWLYNHLLTIYSR